MSMFVRKIEFAKWNQNKILDGEEPSADAITNCMKTRGNTLSLWCINNYDEIEDAILAIASQFDSLESIDILTIEDSLIENSGLQLDCNEGLTPYKAFADRHHDLIELNYSSLGVVAKIIVESIRKDQNQRITRSKLKEIMQNGIRRGKVESSNLKPSVQEKLLI